MASIWVACFILVFGVALKDAKLEVEHVDGAGEVFREANSIAKPLEDGDFLSSNAVARRDRSVLKTEAEGVSDEEDAKFVGSKWRSSSTESPTAVAGGAVRLSSLAPTYDGWRPPDSENSVSLISVWVIPIMNAAIAYDESSGMLLIQAEGGRIQLYDAFGIHQKTLDIDSEWRLLSTAYQSVSKDYFDSRSSKDLVLTRRRGEVGAFVQQLGVLRQEGTVIWMVDQPGISSIRAADLNLDGVDELLVVENKISRQSRSVNSTLLAYDRTGKLLWSESGFDQTVDEVVAGDFYVGEGLEYAVVFDTGGVVVGNEEGVLRSFGSAEVFVTSTIEPIKANSGVGMGLLTLGYRTIRHRFKEADVGTYAARTNLGDSIWKQSSGWLSRTIGVWRNEHILGDTDNPLNACDASIEVSPDHRWAAVPTGGRGATDGICLIDLDSGKIVACQEWSNSLQADYFRYGNLAWAKAAAETILVVSTGQEVIAYRVQRR